jgi:biotin-independent malonate decarboxylase gamma subunit
MSRGEAWIHALSAGDAENGYPSVIAADADVGDSLPGRLLAVVPDPDSPFPRSRNGEVGLLEGIALARAVRDVMALDAERPDDERRAIVSIVDVPSQAYGRLEEEIGEYLYLAAAVDAYASARFAGHPVITIVVGSAISGGFLAHGLQGSQILALDDPAVEIHAMHKPAAARITLRTVEELDEFAKTVAPLSYDVRDWATLGHCDELLKAEDPDHPTEADVRNIGRAIGDAIGRARKGPRDLSNRLQSLQAQRARPASLHTQQVMSEQWGA